MQYRRAKTVGATYFFTVVTYQRQQLFHHPKTIDLLREAFWYVKQSAPFTIDAIVVLPDHLHCLWTLPPHDAEFSKRWQQIKSRFSRTCPIAFRRDRSLSRLHKGEQAIWQRRFWEHQIQDEADFVQHVEYIHYNPVRHGLVEAPRDWLYSSFHRYVALGMVSADWGAGEPIGFPVGVGRE